MGLLDANFTENFELGFSDIFSLQQPIDFPVDVLDSESHRPYYAHKHEDVIRDAEKLNGIRMVSDSKGRLRPDHDSLIRTVMDKFVGIDWKEIIWDAKPYVSSSSSGDKIYFTVMTKQDFITTYNKSDVVCRILCRKK